jgi:hypothetical protein
MADARGAEGSMTGGDQGHKYGEGGSKTPHVVTAREEERDPATNTEAIENISAILFIVLVQCSSRSCSLKSQLGFERNTQIRTLASCIYRSSCMHQPSGSPIIRVTDHQGPGSIGQRWVFLSLFSVVHMSWLLVE